MEDYLQNPKYQANYCEENIWHLGKQYLDLQGSNAYVCLITNSSKTTPIWYQKKCSDLDQPIVWDYHVILLCFLPDHGLVICDFDSVMSPPTPWKQYVVNAFKPFYDLPEIYQQYFRVVSIQDFLNHFASDRSHMYNAETNQWMSEPPEWPIISGPLSSTPHNLFEYLRCEDLDTVYGQLLSITQFIHFCQELEKDIQVGEINESFEKKKLSEDKDIK